MSLEAYEWVTKYAPVPKPDSARLVLYGLAEHAHRDGRRSFPGKARLAEYLGGNTPANKDKVKRALRILEAGGWIKRGYHPDVEALPAHKRPTVWTLNFHHVRQPLPGVSSDPTPGSAVTPPRGSIATHPGVSSDPTPGSAVTPKPVPNRHLTGGRDFPDDAPPNMTPPSQILQVEMSGRRYAIPLEWATDPSLSHCEDHPEGNPSSPCTPCGQWKRAAQRAHTMQARDAGERRKRQQLEERERIAQENARARDALANRRSWREIVAETKNSTDGREESAA